MPEGAAVQSDPVVGQGRRARDLPCRGRSCCGRLPRPAPYQEGACSRPVPPFPPPAPPLRELLASRIVRKFLVTARSFLLFLVCPSNRRLRFDFDFCRNAWIFVDIFVCLW